MIINSLEEDWSSLDDEDHSTCLAAKSLLVKTNLDTRDARVRLKQPCRLRLEMKISMLTGCREVTAPRFAQSNRSHLVHRRPYDHMILSTIGRLRNPGTAPTLWAQHWLWLVWWCYIAINPYKDKSLYNLYTTGGTGEITTYLDDGWQRVRVTTLDFIDQRGHTHTEGCFWALI